MFKSRRIRRSNSKQGNRNPEFLRKVELDKSSLQVINYWQTCLADSERMNVSGKDLQSRGIDLPYAELIDGRCGSTTISQLQRQSSESKQSIRNDQRANDSNERDLRARDLSVLICPLRFVWSGEGDSRDHDLPRFAEIIWIPAILATDGTLRPQRDRGPWISRDLLEPQLLDFGLVVGDVADMEKFSRHNPVENYGSWKDYWSWCNKFFQAVCGSSIPEFRLPDYQARKNCTILLDNSSPGSTRQALRIFSQVLNGSRPAGLLSELSSLKDRHKRKIQHTKQSFSALRSLSLKHRGQFGFEFPLSLSQRTAVHQFLNPKASKILTVTGPPGTGKTTFLQSIVATAWVSAAFAKKELPPVIVACAGTNQAVTNIISTFAKASTRPGPLAGRWLPQVNSYGCYCPSDAKAELAEEKGIQVERIFGNGFSRRMELPEYFAAARELYLRRFAAFSGKHLELKNAVAALHSLIRSEVRSIHSKVSAAADGSFFEGLKNLFRSRTPEEYEQLYEIVASLDCTHRHTAFQLATHYWEGKWLLAVQSLLERGQLPHRGDRMGLNKEDWGRRAMVTPCFVGTFATAPRFFGELSADGKPLIDLLIVDEASQVLPEEGAPCFALAERALVVGDTMQLEPVRSFPKHLDIQNLKKFGLLKTASENELNPLIRKGLTSAYGSVMELAQNACLLVEDNNIGAFLTEHRRSVPGIIAFCNTWAYKGRLRPLRPALENPVLPAMGYAHVPGSARLVGSSRENDFEARVIAQWLEDNRELIESAYDGLPLQDLVAIITPFAAQHHRLQSLLRGSWPRMTIGTVHGLQGAERPIVIFSPVYDEFTKTDFFFDRDDKMLNVAVSRAQDSFLVFGDMAIFNRKSVDASGLPLPSNVLSRFLFASPDNELTDIKIPVIETLAHSEPQHIDTLEGHQSMLRQALELAESEVLVVSPTISSRAIEADKIPAMIEKACARGVRVLVYVDTYLNQEEGGSLKPTADEGCALIRAAGAELYFAEGIHNKTLAIDNDVIVVGSFNWFSAVRDIKSRHQKYEESICYSGPNVPAQIEKTKHLLSRLVVKPVPAAK